MQIPCWRAAQKWLTSPLSGVYSSGRSSSGSQKGMLLLQRGTFQTLEHSIHQVQSSITSKVNLLFTGSVNQFRHAGEVGGVINLQRWNQYQIPEKRETYAFRRCCFLLKWSCRTERKKLGCVVAHSNTPCGYHNL